MLKRYRIALYHICTREIANAYVAAVSSTDPDADLGEVSPGGDALPRDGVRVSLCLLYTSPSPRDS